MSEKDIENEVVKWAKDRGIICIKFTPFGSVGWPDRIFILPCGKHCWIEFKDSGKEPTTLQLHRIKHLRKRDVSAAWFDNAAGAMRWLRMEGLNEGA